MLFRHDAGKEFIMIISRKRYEELIKKEALLVARTASEEDKKKIYSSKKYYKKQDDKTYGTLGLNIENVQYHHHNTTNPGRKNSVTFTCGDMEFRYYPVAKTIFCITDNGGKFASPVQKENVIQMYIAWERERLAHDIFTDASTASEHVKED